MMKDAKALLFNSTSKNNRYFNIDLANFEGVSKLNKDCYTKINVC